ncbi:MAG: EAL domain-containing protein [Pseudomonadota bacterium]|nr:EAL domain-containing protein [Pseudomonadota bacterium]
MLRLANFLLSRKSWKHWIAVVALSVAATEVIVATMSWLLLGRIAPDYLLTGMVASLLVASLVSTLLLLLADKSRALACSLADSESKLRTLFELSPLGIALTDREGLHVEFNAAYLRISGYAEEELRALDCRALTTPEFAEEEARHYELLARDGRNGPYEKAIRCRDGSQMPVRANAIQVRGGANRQYVWTIIEDISEQKLKDKLIWTQANYDALTGLPNRHLLMDLMQMSLATSQRNGLHGAMLLLDLDHFKTLNDTLGHGQGDKLLREVANRLRSLVRNQDTIARLGGDEFMVLLEDLSQEATEAAVQAEVVAENIRAGLGQPFVLDRTEHHISSSIGIVLFLGRRRPLEDLVSYADAAMYQAKSDGRNTIRFHDPKMQAVLEKRGALEQSIRLALSRNEFRLHYQLQVDQHGKGMGVEALIRWQHPEQGTVSPADFIPVAEETGLIVPIGKWVMETACRQIKDWRDNPDMAGLTVAVNVSARQFQDPDFVAHVRELVELNAIPCGHLKLELTESMVLHQVEESIRKMEVLRKLGVRFSLDDFGTCYSSLAYLKRLPLDQIKIDRSFVLDITHDPNDAVIVKAILSLAGSLGLDAIAEGVETGEHRNFLELHGCLAYQGFLYSRPVPAEVLEQEMATRPA